MIDFGAFLYISFWRELIIDILLSWLLFAWITVPILVLIIVFCVWKRYSFGQLIKLVVIFVGVVALVISITSIYTGDLGYARYLTDYKLVDEFSNRQHEKLVDLFSKGFPEAEACLYKGLGVDICSRQNYRYLYEVINLPDDQKYDQFSGTYFVKLSERGTLQKMHISGNFIDNKVNTRGEKVIKKLLESNKRNLIQALVGTVSRIKYLNDWRSDLEVFVPVQVDGKTVGMIVHLLGT